MMGTSPSSYLLSSLCLFSDLWSGDRNSASLVGPLSRVSEMVPVPTIRAFHGSCYSYC